MTSEATVAGSIVWALDVDADLEAVGVHTLALEEAGLLGVSEEHGRATVWLPQRRDDLPLEGRWRTVRADGWVERWHAEMEPVLLGRFVVVPPWHATGGDAHRGDDHASRREIVLEPGQAFGTGHHETTARCAAALESLELAGRTVVDVGTGSGLLAVIAARLGAARVVGCDVDPLAVVAARRTAATNGAEIEVVHGSLDALGDLCADVMVANLDTATVVRLAGDLVARCADRLLVSGVSNERVQEAVAALTAAGARDVVASPGRQWALLTTRCGPSGADR